MKFEIIVVIFICIVVTLCGYTEYKNQKDCDTKGGTWMGGNIHKCIDVKELK